MTMPSLRVGATAIEALIVDDDVEVRELLAEHVRSRGLKVGVASDGRAAIEAIKRSPGQFGLILCDLHLPGAGGLEVLQAARGANASCSVVIITGYASLDSAIQAVRLGAYDYVTKPFSLGQIDVILRRVEDRNALELENRRLLQRLEALDGSAGHAGSFQPSSPVSARLGQLEVRLDAIEVALRDLLDELRRQSR
jgi:two-component system, NtrC family, response regulator AtoC